MLEPLDPRRIEEDLAEQIHASIPRFTLKKKKNVNAPVA